jgi:hypothetical protein
MTTPTASRAQNRLPHTASAARRDAGTSSAAPPLPAIAFFDGKDPVPPARAVLRARLDAVLAEQDERARLAHA